MIVWVLADHRVTHAHGLESPDVLTAFRDAHEEEFGTIMFGLRHRTEQMLER